MGAFIERPSLLLHLVVLDRVAIVEYILGVGKDNVLRMRLEQEVGPTNTMNLELELPSLWVVSQLHPLQVVDLVEHIGIDSRLDLAPFLCQR